MKRDGKGHPPNLEEVAGTLRRAGEQLTRAAAALRSAAREQQARAAAWAEAACRIREVVNHMRDLAAQRARVAAARPVEAQSLPAARRFTYADYLELHAWEFEKFRFLPAITEAEIAAARGMPDS